MNQNYTQNQVKKSRSAAFSLNRNGTHGQVVSHKQKSALYKVLLFFIGGILFTPALWSQSFLHDMKSRFRFVQPSQGTLISGFAPMIELEGANGQADADTLGFDQTQEVFRLGLLNEYGLNHYDARLLKYRERQQQFLAAGLLPIGLVDVQYQEANPALERQNRVSITDDSSFRFDLNGYDGAVYLSKYLFSAVLPLQQIRTDVDFAILDSQLVISSFSNWRNLKWKWVGGGKTIPVELNVPFRLPKNGVGGPVLGSLQCEVAETDPRVDLMESPWLLGSGRVGLGSFFKLFFNFPNGSAPDLLAKNDLSVHYYVDPIKPSLKAMYTVHLGYNEFGKVRTCMEKPIVIVEGVDYGYPGYPAGFKDQKYGENGYIDLLKGENWDVPSQIWKNWESISEAPLALERLRKAGFDIVYVDFWDGAQDMNHNAEVLIEVIKKLQRQMCAREMHVLGVSMGGIVAKRALRQMENRGISHCVVSLTSFDSPHQGANLSLGLQNTIKYFKGTFGVCDDLFHRIVRRTATEQLLVNHESSNLREANARRLWLREDSLYGGYPNKPWLFAISNGSADGKNANMNYSGSEKLQPGMPLMRLQFKSLLLFGWINNYLVDIYAENFYDRKSGEYYNGRVNFGKKFYSNKNNLLWDHVPGSTMKQFQIFEELGKSWLLKTGFLSDQSCFVPTVSSLDLRSIGFDAQTIVEKDFDVHAGDLSNVLSNDMHTPFQRVYVPSTNQAHIKLDTSKNGNINWLIAQLLDVSDADDAHTVTNDYNLRSPHSRTLKGLTVSRSGMFELNGVGNTPSWTAADSLLARSAQERVFYAGDCAGANFQVRDSGLFIIGKHVQRTKLILGGNTNFEVKHNGELRIVKGGNTLVLSAGSELWLTDDAVLRIEDGSQLIIESGATLRISDRARLLLQGSGALFHVKGTLILDSGVQFQPIPGVDGIVGLVKFTAVGHGFGDAHILAKGGARMRFEGNGKNGSRTLQIEGPVKFPESGIGKDLVRFDITRSVVCFGPASRAYLKGRVSVTQSRMEPVEWSNAYCGGFHFVGARGTFENLDFERQDTGIYYDQGGSIGMQSYSGNVFARCKVGMHVETSYVHVSKSSFEANGVGLSMNNIWKESVIESSKFHQNEVAVQVQNASESYGQLLTLNNEFYENTRGYDLDKVGIFINCHRFGGNKTGVMAKESSLRMDGSVVLESALLGRKFSAGVNVFTNQQDAAIELQNSEMWASGYNYFHHNKSTYKGQPFITGDYRLVKAASYYDYGTGRVNLGSNKFFPSHSKFTSDSLNAQFVTLKNSGFPLAVQANLMNVYEGAVCAIDRDPTNVLSMKYALNGSELGHSLHEDITDKVVIGGSGMLKILASEVDVRVYATNGILVQQFHTDETNRELALAAGIYFVHVSGVGINQTEKVFVHP